MHHEKKIRTMLLWALVSAMGLLWITTSATADDLREQRKELAWRPRGIVYNDDGLGTEPYRTPEELISVRVEQVANTQVDTICYCTGGGGLFWAHQPQVGEVLGEYVYDETEQYVKNTRDGLLALKELGTDPLAVVVDYGHANNMEVFWSYRMNNPEDSFVDWGLARWKREHPDYIMGVRSDYDAYPATDPRQWWTLNDFAKPEVRCYLLRIFGDICNRYDIDGVELDFIRHPLYFRPNLDGLPAEPQHVAMMTDLVRRIRAITKCVSIKRGRPLLVQVRTPLSVESALAIGLDIPAYLKEDLVDTLIAGVDYEYVSVASSLKDMVDLGHKYQVPVYALITPGASVENCRAGAMNRWYWGADGIYTFNLVSAVPDERFSHLGSAETLKGLNKTYAIDYYLPGTALGTFELALVLRDCLPITLIPYSYVTAKLPVGEDIVANTPAGKTVSALLRFQVSSLVLGDTITVKLNGQSLGTPSSVSPLSGSPTRASFQLSLTPQQVKPGYNLIDIQLTTGRIATIVLDSLDLVVTYE